MATYDPKQVTVSFGGVTAVQFATDSIIKATMNEDGYTYQPSATGQGTRSRNANESGRVEISLQNGSPTNDEFMDLYKGDRSGGGPPGSLLIKDNTSFAGLVEAEIAWITKLPDFERAKESGEVTWVIETAELKINHSGTEAP